MNGPPFTTHMILKELCVAAMHPTEARFSMYTVSERASLHVVPTNPSNAKKMTKAAGSRRRSRIRTNRRSFQMPRSSTIQFDPSPQKVNVFHSPNHLTILSAIIVVDDAFSILTGHFRLEIC
jgi:hypothetical protein